jgi:hypothetical protein
MRPMRPLCFPYLHHQRQQRAAAIEFGGGDANFGTLTVRDSTVLSNTAPLGGDLYNAGVVSVFDSTVGDRYDL